MESATADLGIESLLAHEGWLRRVIVELVDEHHVEDVLQETWAAALARGPGRLISPRAWLRRVARGQAMRRRRAEVRGRQREAVAARDEALPSTEQLVERLHAHRRVAEAVAELEEPYRTVVLLRYFEDQPPREIARRLGQSGSTVRTRLERGLQRLRGRLEGADRRALAAVILAPRAGEAVPTAAPALALELAAGVLTMTVRQKAVAAVAAVLFCVFGVWVAAGDGQAGETTPPPPPAPMAAHVEAEPPAEEALVERSPVAAEAETEVATGAPLSGRAVDPRGQPVAGVALRFFPEESVVRVYGAMGVVPAPDESESLPFGETDRDGRFSEPWPHPLGSLYATGDHVTVRAFTPSEKDRASREALLVVAPSVTVHGSVVNQSGQALAGVLVKARVDGLLEYPESIDHTHMVGLPETYSDDQGRFELAGVPQLKELKLTFAKNGYDSQTWPGVVGRGDLEVVLMREDRRGYRVSGTVVDEGGGLVANATVLLFQKIAKTNRHGEFTVRVPELPDSARLLGGLPGFQPGELKGVAEAVRREEDRHLQDVVLQLGPPALAIRGQVLDPHDRPMSGLVVALMNPDAIESWHTVEDFVAGRSSEIANEGKTIMKVDARTDDEGRFEIRGLSPRGYTVRVFDPATLAGATIEVEAGDRDLVVRVDAEARRRISGTVTTQAGAPLAQIRVAWGLRTFDTGMFSLFAPAGTTVTDDRGKFVVEGLPMGDVSLSFAGDDVVSLEQSLTDVADGAELSLRMWARYRFRCELSATKGTRVRVLDEAGETLSLRRTLGQIIHSGEDWTLTGGRTPVLEVSEAGRTLVVLRDGVEIDRRVMVLGPDRVEVVR